VRHTRIIVTHYGGPDAAQVVEEDCPDPKRGEVRVGVLVVGVSLPDVMGGSNGCDRRGFDRI
jgi:NADPH:quinone reductase